MSVFSTKPTSLKPSPELKPNLTLSSNQKNGASSHSANKNGVCHEAIEATGQKSSPLGTKRNADDDLLFGAGKSSKAEVTEQIGKTTEATLISKMEKEEFDLKMANDDLGITKEQRNKILSLTEGFEFELLGYCSSSLPENDKIILFLCVKYYQKFENWFIVDEADDTEFSTKNMFLTLMEKIYSENYPGTSRKDCVGKVLSNTIRCTLDKLLTEIKEIHMPKDYGINLSDFAFEEFDLKLSHNFLTLFRDFSRESLTKLFLTRD